MFEAFARRRGHDERRRLLCREGAEDLRKQRRMPLHQRLPSVGLHDFVGVQIDEINLQERSSRDFPQTGFDWMRNRSAKKMHARTAWAFSWSAE